MSHDHRIAPGDFSYNRTDIKRRREIVDDRIEQELNTFICEGRTQDLSREKVVEQSQEELAVLRKAEN